MILALAGGVGGARLANGLARLLAPGELVVAVNVGDDFTHFGLDICPDLDSILYTLAGRNNQALGWGVEGESWAFMDEVRRLGGDDWFALGDRDLATHVLRTMWRRAGRSLSAVTAELARRRGVAQKIVPASDDPLRSMVRTDEGELAFQDYFVRRRCQPRFLGIRFAGAETARMAPGLAQALADPALAAIVICPSNPWLSIAPLLAVPGVVAALKKRKVPVVAVSPFIGGEAVKGPAAKIVRELGEKADSSALLRCYAGLVDGVLCDEADPLAGTTEGGVALRGADTLMADDGGQVRVAREALAFAADLCRR